MNFSLSDHFLLKLKEVNRKKIMNSSTSLPSLSGEMDNTTMPLTEEESSVPKSMTSADDDEAPKFKRPASVPLEKKIKKKKKSKVVCSCNVRFKTIQKILEALGYKVLGLMKDEPEKAGCVLHLLDDFERKLDVIQAGPMIKKEQVCLAKKHLFNFWDALSRLDMIYGPV